jgi:dethiobiotin synthetase
MAPPMAAEALGLPAPSLADLVGELTWPPGVGVGIVEAAGGVRSPLGADGDSADLARALDPDLVVLVADAGLGTIHAVRSSGPALAAWPPVVLLNRYDAGSDLHRRNRAWLAERDGLPVYTDVAEVAALVHTEQPMAPSSR